MDLVHAVLLGVVQGLTEFLPVSSDGHLAAFALLFDVPNMSLTMIVFLHAGTLAATLIVLRREILEVLQHALRDIKQPRRLLTTAHGRTVIGVLIASVPTALIGLTIEDAVEAWAKVPWIVGVCLLVTAATLLATRRKGAPVADAPATGEHLDAPVKPVSWLGYFMIGVMQGIAVLPGVSRSGSTIATAMYFGMPAEAAFRFSFLLSLPAVGGAVTLKMLEPGAFDEIGTGGLIGGVVSFFVGLGALLLLRKIVERGRFWVFSMYLVPLGLSLIAWDLLRR